MNAIISWLVESSEEFQFILFFGLLFLLMLIEQIFSLRKVAKSKRWRANFMLSVIAILTMISIPITFISAAQYAADMNLGLINHIQLNWIILGVLTLLLRGFISYITHFLMHKISLLWRIHRVHHLDTELDVSTTVRFHPFEFIANSIIGIPIILIFGFPVWGLMLYELFDVTITLFSHSNISLPTGIEKFIRYIIVTPDLHRVHHSSYQPETDSNFSAVFPIWDILFRTFRTKTKNPQHKMELGLEEVRDSRANNIFWLMLSPFKNLKLMRINNEK